MTVAHWLAFGGGRAPSLPWLILVIVGFVCGGAFVIWQLVRFYNPPELPPAPRDARVHTDLLAPPPADAAAPAAAPSDAPGLADAPTPDG
jgi:hypothetical protein